MQGGVYANSRLLMPVSVEMKTYVCNNASNGTVILGICMKEVSVPVRTSKYGAIHFCFPAFEDSSPLLFDVLLRYLNPPRIASAKDVQLRYHSI